MFRTVGACSLSLDCRCTQFNTQKIPPKLIPIPLANLLLSIAEKITYKPRTRYEMSFNQGTTTATDKPRFLTMKRNTSQSRKDGAIKASEIRTRKTKPCGMISPGQTIKAQQKLERETGFEPATSTLARSHSTAELLPLVLSFYSTCTSAANSLHPHWLPFAAPPLFYIGQSTTIRQETLDELALSVPCLVAVVHVVHRHVQVRMAKHASHDHWIVSVVDQECGETVS